MNKFTWTIFALISVGFVAFMVILSDKAQIDTSNIDVLTIQKAGDQNGRIGDTVFGKADSKVTLIEYGDYQCPGCGDEHYVVKKILEEYKGQIRFVFRNFPLTGIHPNAKAAAGAVEAAGLQGKYWEMHNKIYESQSAWSNLGINERNDMFASYAKALKLDVDKFNSDIASVSVNDKISYDTALGNKAAVKGTPTFYLNDKLIESKIWGDSDKFKAAINDELEKAGIELPLTQQTVDQE